MVAEYIVYRCPDGSLLLDWNETAWKFGYPAYPKHRCTEIERGYSEGGPALPKLYSAIKKKYLEEGSRDETCWTTMSTATPGTARTRCTHSAIQ